MNSDNPKAADDSQVFADMYLQSLGNFAPGKMKPLDELLPPLDEAQLAQVSSSSQSVSEVHLPTSPLVDTVKFPEASPAQIEGESASVAYASGESVHDTKENLRPRLKVLFCGMDGRFSTTPLQVLATEHNIVGIVHSEPRPVKKGWIASWASLGRNRGNLEEFAKYYKCPFYSVGHNWDYELLRFIKYLKPDIICIANFSIILPPDIFELPKYGTLNLHMASLPQYRGSNPWLWMFYDGVKECECVVHQVDAGEDSGPIIAREAFAVTPGVTGSELADEVVPLAASLLLRAVGDMARGTARPEAQTPGQYRRARYVANGEPIIDWQQWNCERIANFLRGASIWYEPYMKVPGLYRQYLPAVPGKVKGKLGSMRLNMKGGRIICQDGVVPFVWRIDSYEMARIIVPLFLIFALYVIL